MADLTYEGNSQAMVTKLIESSQKPFRAMTEKKLLAGLEAKATGAEAIVTACPFCEQNLKEPIERNKEKIKMYDLTDIIEMAL